MVDATMTAEADNLAKQAGFLATEIYGGYHPDVRSWQRFRDIGLKYLAAQHQRAEALTAELDACRRADAHHVQMRQRCSDDNVVLSRLRAAAEQRAEALAARLAQVEAALKLFTTASMSESRPTSGESSIGWQRGDGPTASERVAIARAALAQPQEKRDE